MIQKLTGGGLNLRYAYTADDERILEFDVTAFQSVWRLRDLGGQVIREIRLDNNTDTWSWQKDWIRRDGQPLAAVDAFEGRRYLHPDHLGSTRVLTDSGGFLRSTYYYEPYGELAASSSPGFETLLFTGHERDDHLFSGGAGGTTDDLDYMHARYYNPMLGRFLRVDPINSAKLGVPLSWNKYLYALSNPGKYGDPNGRASTLYVVKAGNDLSEKFGHAALHIVTPEGSGWIDAGGENSTRAGTDALMSDLTPKEFVQTYLDDGRVVIEAPLATTPEQDQLMLSEAQRKGGFTSQSGSIRFGNCSLAVVQCLRAGGVIDSKFNPAAFTVYGGFVDLNIANLPSVLLETLIAMGLIDENTVVRYEEPEDGQKEDSNAGRTVDSVGSFVPPTQ